MAQKKLKLTKKKAEEFCKKNLGTSKGLEYIYEAYVIHIGAIRYHFWLLNGRIYMQHSIGCLVKDSSWWNLETLEFDDEYTMYYEKKNDDYNWYNYRLETLEWLKEKFENKSYLLWDSMLDDEIKKYIKKVESY